MFPYVVGTNRVKDLCRTFDKTYAGRSSLNTGILEFSVYFDNLWKPWRKFLKLCHKIWAMVLSYPHKDCSSDTWLHILSQHCKKLPVEVDKMPLVFAKLLDI